MDLKEKLAELKYDYVRLQGDLEKENPSINKLTHYYDNLKT